MVTNWGAGCWASVGFESQLTSQRSVELVRVPEAEVKRKALSGAWLPRLLIIEPHIGNQERQDSVDCNRWP